MGFPSTKLQILLIIVPFSILKFNYLAMVQNDYNGLFYPYFYDKSSFLKIRDMLKAHFLKIPLGLGRHGLSACNQTNFLTLDSLLGNRFTQDNGKLRRLQHRRN
jgi:hypothetical protein